VLLESGARWWPDDIFEREHIRPEQEARFEADVWDEEIAGYLSTKERVTIGEVGKEALRLEIQKLGTADQRRIAAVLKRLCWERLPVDSKGKRYWAPSRATAHSAQQRTPPEEPFEYDFMRISQ
jgi:hypothetical protein